MHWTRNALLAGLVAATTAVIGVGAAPPSAAQNPKERSTAARELGSPDYGVCRGPDERCYHDWGNFNPANGYKVLLFTRTAGPRHASLGPALGTCLNPPLAGPSKVRILATVDEQSLTRGVTGSMGHPGHGDEHPLAWCQYYDGGRAWLTTLGHDALDFSDGTSFPGAAQFQQLLVGGIRSAMGADPFCRWRRRRSG